MSGPGGKMAKFLSQAVGLATSRESSEELIFEGRSAFHQISICDQDGQRVMYFGPCGQEAETAVDLRCPGRSVFEYPGLMCAALPLRPEGRRVLMLGLGGGFIAGLFQKHLPEYSLTVVELDPLVAELARNYFGFQAGANVRLELADGRDFIAVQPEGSWDQIWLDAFGGDYVPPHLMGLDFLRLCLSRLSPGGLLVQNLHQSRPQLFQRQLKETREVFGRFLGFNGQRSGNAVIIAAAPGGRPWPDKWSPEALKKLAKNFGSRLGPYELTEEMSKVYDFKP